VKPPRSGIRVWAVMALAACLASCETIEQNIEILTGGRVTAGDAQKVLETGEKIRGTFADITEEEEYYIGRSVAALILAKYPVYENEAVTRYLNTVGNAVSAFSDRPEIYAGYHFLVLDSEEVNALSAPSGFIFVTKGLLRRCRDEEMLALILAHEVGHVTGKHGLQAIKKSRLAELFTFVGTEAVQRYGPEQIARLTNLFEGALSDIVEQLIERGYDRKYEYDADAMAVAYGSRTGYEPGGIVRFLETMVNDTSPAAGRGWFKTHPTAEQRIDRINREIGSLKTAPRIDEVRTKRLKQSVGALK
jgi:predicted Zn-dependent protease